MRNYLARLQALSPRRSLATPCKRRVALLSGQNDYTHSELSPDQIELLNCFKPFNYALLTAGFPFNRDHHLFGQKRAGLPMASFRNTEQFLHTLWNTAYQKAIARHLQPLFLSSPEIVLICQSSGLNMLKYASPYFTVPAHTQVTLLALGPVVWGAFKDPRFRLITIRGDADWISMGGDHSPAAMRIQANHLNYCSRPQLHTFIRTLFAHED